MPAQTSEHTVPTIRPISTASASCREAIDGKDTVGFVKVSESGFSHSGSNEPDDPAEFWENRVAATSLRPQQTKVPEVPDQTSFLESWYAFHRGYRTVTRQDGSEERIAVIGEPWKDVSPGQLPRTLDELRAGRDRSAADEVQYIAVEEIRIDDGPSIEDTLDQLFEAEQASEPPDVEDQTVPRAIPRPPVNVAGQVMQPAASRNREYQTRRIASLRRELQRMRNGVERVIAGLRELGDNVPNSLNASGRLADLDRSLDDILDSQPEDPGLAAPTEPGQTIHSSGQQRGVETVQLRLDEAIRLHSEALSNRDSTRAHCNEIEGHLERVKNEHAEVLSRLDDAEDNVRIRRQNLERSQRERRTGENYLRVFGTREDYEREDYVSPIGGMFNNAWNRCAVAEQARREERTLRSVLDDEQTLEDARRRAAMPDQQNQAQERTSPAADTQTEDRLNQYYTMLRNQDWAQRHTTQSEEANFPQSMLTAFRELDQEERQARVQFLTSLDTQRNVADTDQPSTGRSVSRYENENSILTRLLRDTPEPERSVIIARMTENGTAQALQATHTGDASTATTDPMLLWRRLQEDQEPVVTFSDSDSDTGEDQQGLDKDDGRPEPRPEEEMTVKMECKVCYTQLADTACLPCGHLVLCQWCSEQHSPVMDHDRTRPRRPANCPVCRKRIKQKVKIYRP